MKNKPIMPGRQIQDEVRRGAPQLLQRPWYFCGFVPDDHLPELSIPCAHGRRAGLWVGLHGVPSIQDMPTFAVVRLRPCVVIRSRVTPNWLGFRYQRQILKDTRIWFGQCETCEKVFWMMDGKGRIIEQCHVGA